MRGRSLAAAGALAIGALIAGRANAGACPGTGSCFLANTTPGCSDAACCETVCAFDPFCCATQWDQFCVGEASDVCNCAPACSKDNVECLDPSPQYDSRRPVGAMVAGDGSGVFCTAWIVAAPNIVMTNEHCTAGGVGGVSVAFNLECDECTGGDPKVPDVYAVLEVIHASAPLDYALLRVEGNPAATWGVLATDDADPVIGAGVYEIHHGEGRVKGYDDGQVLDLDVPGSCTAGTTAEMKVSAVATGGASGSPILSLDTHCVIGICHCGPPCAAGWGVPMSYVMPDAMPWIVSAGGAPAKCGDEPCPWDCESSPDGGVDVDDFLAVLAQWGQTGTSCDFDGAGVDVDAFLELLAHWGLCP